MTFMMTTIVGIILGIFGSKILLMIVLRLLGINVSVSIIFNYHAILETLLLIAVSYVLIVFQSYVYLLKRSIKELASDVNKKSSVIHAQHLVSCIRFARDYYDS